MQTQSRPRMDDLAVDAVMHVDLSREGRIQENAQLHRYPHVLAIGLSEGRRDLVHPLRLELRRLQKGHRFNCLLVDVLCHFQLDEVSVGGLDGDARDPLNRERRIVSDDAQRQARIVSQTKYVDRMV